jgi:hypothetical protein
MPPVADLQLYPTPEPSVYPSTEQPSVELTFIPSTVVISAFPTITQVPSATTKVSPS